LADPLCPNFITRTCQSLHWRQNIPAQNNPTPKDLDDKTAAPKRTRPLENVQSCWRKLSPSDLAWGFKSLSLR